jgi:hypothetical protein
MSYNKEVNDALLNTLKKSKIQTIGLDNYKHLNDWEYDLETEIEADSDDGEEMIKILQGDSQQPVDVADLKTWTKKDRKVQVILRKKVNNTLYHITRNKSLCPTAHSMYLSIRQAILNVTSGDLEDLADAMKAYTQVTPETKMIRKLEDYLRVKQEKIDYYNVAAKLGQTDLISEPNQIRYIRDGLDNSIWFQFKLTWNKISDKALLQDFLKELRDGNKIRLKGLPDYETRAIQTHAPRPKDSDTVEDTSNQKAKPSKGFKAKWTKDPRQQNASNSQKNSTEKLKPPKTEMDLKNYRCIHCGKLGHSSKPCTNPCERDKCSHPTCKDRLNSPAKLGRSDYTEETTHWGRHFLAASYRAAERRHDDKIVLSPIDNGSSFSAFPTSDWFIESTLKTQEGKATETIDGRIVKAEQTGVAIFRLCDPESANYLVITIPDSDLQPGYVGPVIAQRKLSKLQDWQITIQDKSEDLQQPLHLHYQGSPFAKIYPAKDELFYASIMKATDEEKLQALDALKNNKGFYAAPSKQSEVSKFQLHTRFGHPKGANLDNLIKRTEAKGTKVTEREKPLICTSCDMAKLVPLPSKPHDRRQRTEVLPGEKWSHDSSGKMSVPAIGFNGGLYRSIAVDYHSGKGDIRITKTRAEHRAHLQDIQRRIDRYFGGHRFKAWHTDNAKETTGKEQLEYNTNEGIISSKSPPYYHQGNPDAENRMKINELGALSLMINGRVPKKFWGWAAITQEYLYQFIPPAVDRLDSKA